MAASNVTFVEDEIERLPFADQSFDVVISNGVIDLSPTKTPSSPKSSASSHPAVESKSRASRFKSR